ncbi:MAG: hypothetical protein LBB82_04150 [Treponema sp.]|jgi:hypothetical protein|nr:hypothetical protein [Treponema sp.]
MKGFVAILLVALAAQTVFSRSLEDLIDVQSAAALRRGERVNRMQFKDPVLALAPRDAQIRALVTGLIGELGPSFFGESLARYQKPRAGEWSAAERAGLYNSALALSTLTGLQYYSASRRQMRTFYETSSIVSGPDGKTPRPDPRYGEPPPELTVYVRQKDLSFGDNIYQYRYIARSDCFIFIQENLTAMSYGIIPVVGKNRLRSLVAVFDAGDSLLIYTVSMAKAASVPGLADRVSKSFGNRAEAILNWFTAQAESAYAKLGR